MHGSDCSEGGHLFHSMRDAHISYQLDELYNPGISKVDVRKAKQHERERQKRKKRVKKQRRAQEKRSEFEGI